MAISIAFSHIYTYQCVLVGPVFLFYLLYTRSFVHMKDEALEGDDNEHAYYSTYKDFVQLFEDNLAKWIEQDGISHAHFLRACRTATEAAEDGIENMATVFLDLMLASSSYEAFLSLMQNEAEEARQMGKIGQGGTGGGGTLSKK